MEMRRGIPLFCQQFTALLKKNLLLSWRNPCSTLIQLFAAFIFTLLLFFVLKSKKYALSSAAVTELAAIALPPIPPCESKHFLRNPCFDFVWSGNDSPRVSHIVRRIMANNPGRPVPSDKVKSFRTPVEVDSWLFGNQLRCDAALHFRELHGTVLTYGLQTNYSAGEKRGRIGDDSSSKLLLISLHAAAEREIARSIIGDPNFNWIIGLKEFAHPARDQLSVMSSFAPAFFLAFAMFGFVLQISALVTEKELKLRQAMSTMGLYDSAYWLSWIVWRESLFPSLRFRFFSSE